MKPAIALMLLTFALIYCPQATAEPAFQWEEIFDGGGAYQDTGISALCSADGQLIAGGISCDRFDQISTHIRKLDSATGELIWSHGYGATEDNSMVFGDFFEDSDGNIVVGAFLQICAS